MTRSTAQNGSFPLLILPESEYNRPGSQAISRVSTGRRPAASAQVGRRATITAPIDVRLPVPGM
jgi:hypothetical protein